MLVSLFMAIFAVVQSQTVTLTDSKTPPCLGKMYQLICTHPVLTNSLLYWERNGAFFSTSASSTHVEVETNTTASTVTITLTREEFGSKVHSYRCYSLDQISGERVYSNNKTVAPPDVPLPTNIRYMVKTTQATIIWDYTSEDTCYSNYSFNIVWCNSNTRCTSIEPRNNENTVTRSKLIPGYTYNITTKLQVNGINFIVQKKIIHALTLLTITPSESFVCHNTILRLTCIHHNLTPLDDNFTSAAVHVIWMKNGIPVTDGISSPRTMETVLSIPVSHDLVKNGTVNYSCAYNYSDGSNERSDLYYVASNELFESTGTAILSNQLDEENMNIVFVVEIPRRPENIKVDETGMNHIQVSWSHSTKCFEAKCNQRVFDIYWFLNHGTTQELKGEKKGVVDTSYDIEGLSMSTYYRIEIIAMCSGMDGRRGKTVVETDNNIVPKAVGSTFGVLISILTSAAVLIFTCCYTWRRFHHLLLRNRDLIKNLWNFLKFTTI